MVVTRRGGFPVDEHREVRDAVVKRDGMSLGIVAMSDDLGTTVALPGAFVSHSHRRKRQTGRGFVRNMERRTLLCSSSWIGFGRNCT